jgi:hypothetical protein
MGSSSSIALLMVVKEEEEEEEEALSPPLRLILQSGEVKYLLHGCTQTYPLGQAPVLERGSGLQGQPGRVREEAVQSGQSWLFLLVSV